VAIEQPLKPPEIIYATVQIIPRKKLQLFVHVNHHRKQDCLKEFEVACRYLIKIIGNVIALFMLGDVHKQPSL
jgi:hypothetical protein